MSMQRFQKRKKPNYKRGIVLILLLVLIVILWYYAEDLIHQFFDVKE